MYKNTCGINKRSLNQRIIHTYYSFLFVFHYLCIDDFSFLLQSLSSAKITIQCEDIHTQACDPENKVYDYALFSRDWTWEQYSM